MENDSLLGNLGDVAVLISQKQEELSQINQLRVNALEKILIEKTETIKQFQLRRKE